MKVLFFSHQSAFIYGGEICTMAFMQELLRQGVEVHFAAPSGPYMDRVCTQLPQVKVILVPSVEFRRKLNSLTKFFTAFQKTKLLLSDYCLKNKIQILHATSLKSMVYLYLLSGKQGLSVVWHHHDILPDSISNRTWLKLLSIKAKKILVPSKATGEALKDAGIDHDKIEVLYNGFDTSAWMTRKPFDDCLIVTILGEISYRKGSDWIKKIIENLEGTLKTSYQIWVIGAGLSDPEFANNVLSENEEFQIKGLVKFFGRREDIKDLLQQSDVLLVPSRQDPLPTVIIEAYLSGVPAIGAPNGGIPEMIENYRTGYICRNPEEFADKIRVLAADFELRKKMSQNARAFAERKFSIDKNTKQLVSLYAKILGR